MVLHALPPGSRLWSLAILVLALAAQALSAPYTVIANVQRHVVSSDGNTVRFPAQVTIQCPEFFGLQCRHQVNDHQVIINVFHGNPDGEGNGVLSHVKSIIFTGGRVETSQDSLSQFPPYNVKHATEGTTSRGDSEMNDISSGESFNGNAREEDRSGQYGESAEMTTVKDDESFLAFFNSDKDSAEEKQTEPPQSQETETENTSTSEFNWDDYFKEEKNDKSKESENKVNDESENKSDTAAMGDNDNNKLHSNEETQEKSGEKDDVTTEPSSRSNENQFSNFNEYVSEDDGNTPRADRYTSDEVFRNEINSVETTTSNSILTGNWWNLGRK